MNSYSLSKCYFYRTNISIEQNQMLKLENKSIINFYNKFIPLEVLSTQLEIIHKKLSLFMRSVFLAVLAGFLGLFFMIGTDPEFSKMINLPLLIAFMIIILIASYGYYRNENRSYINFYYINKHRIAFSLPYKVEDVALDQWKKQYLMAVKKAKVSDDRLIRELVKKGIEIFEKQNIIHASFAAELLRRVSLQ